MLLHRLVTLPILLLLPEAFQICRKCLEADGREKGTEWGQDAVDREEGLVRTTLFGKVVSMTTYQLLNKANAEKC